MIVPLLSMSITGAIWYQGESNSNDPNYYACAFPEMIKDWRHKFNQDLFFYYAQLCPWNSGDKILEALTRLAQLYANKLPRVGFGTAMDLGDPTSPWGDIHPRDKEGVGKRLAASARVITYGQNIPYLGPMADAWKIVSPTGNAVVEVSFTPASLGTGLTTRSATCPNPVPLDQCGEYEIGTSAGWVPAKGEVVGNIVTVSASVGSAQVIGVRYGFANWPIATLWNRDGFPAIPFFFPDPITPKVPV